MYKGPLTHSLLCSKFVELTLITTTCKLLGTLMDDIKLKTTHHSNDSYLLRMVSGYVKDYAISLKSLCRTHVYQPGFCGSLNPRDSYNVI